MLNNQYNSWRTGIQIDNIYPIGSIYMSVDQTNPGTLFGGSWEAIQDRFLLGAGNSYNVENTGGAVSHTHTTSNHTLTINEIPSHNHSGSTGNNSVALSWTDGSGSSGAGATIGNSVFYLGTRVSGTAAAAGSSHNHSIGSNGGGGAHNHGNTGSSSNLPPYFVVYMWKRVA